MSDPDESAGRKGRRQLSRRKILWGLATTGAAASAGGGTAALLADRERGGASLTAGTLDLETAWGNEATVGNNSAVVDDVPSIDLGEVEEGATGTFSANVAVSGNPASVCFRTKCPREGKTDVGEAIQVTVTVEANGSTIDAWNGSLHDVRQQLGPGVCFDRAIDPDDAWQIVVDWEVTDTSAINGKETVSFAFDFHAEQTRHADPSLVPPTDWTCTDDGTTPAISNVAFCTDTGEPISPSYPDDFAISGTELTLKAPAFEISGSTLLFDDGTDTVPVTAVVVKYGTFLDVFTNFSTLTLSAGTASETYKKGTTNDYPETSRSPSTPCPGECGYKYNVGTGPEQPKCD